MKEILLMVLRKAGLNFEEIFFRTFAFSVYGETNASRYDVL